MHRRIAQGYKVWDTQWESNSLEVAWLALLAYYFEGLVYLSMHYDKNNDEDISHVIVLEINVCLFWDGFGSRHDGGLQILLH